MTSAKAKLKPRSPSAEDVEMGSRIRKLRLERKISQPKLAAAIGVTFQQLQKYEKGINRVKADRITTIATALKVRPESLYQNENEFPAAASLIDVTDESVLRMLRAWIRIEGQNTQREMVSLVEAIAVAASNTEV